MISSSISNNFFSHAFLLFNRHRNPKPHKEIVVSRIEPLAVTPNSLKLLVANLVESLSHWEFHSHASVGVQLQDRFMKTFVQLHQKLLLVCGLVRGKDIVEGIYGDHSFIPTSCVWFVVSGYKLHWFSLVYTLFVTCMAFP
ncbi:hypothetical protein QL285_082052 [Trifolium repens]|nr:hypothetical protein QL285_082052 [Trifolium repens]